MKSADGAAVRTLLLFCIAGLAGLEYAGPASAQVGTPDLTIAKTHAGTFTTGQVGAPYTITVRSVAGPTAGPTLGPVIVADSLPAGLTATSMFGFGWSCDLAAFTCTRSDPLTPGNSYPAITLIVNVAADALCIVTNTVMVFGGGDVTPGNNNASDPALVVGGQPLSVTPPGPATTTQTLCQ